MVEGGNLIGLTEDEYNSLSIAKQNSLKNRAITTLENAGADYVIDNLQDLINLISAIDTDQKYEPQPAPILLTPGPLTTSPVVKKQMSVDHGTWDDEYKADTQAVRQALLKLANVSSANYTAVLMQEAARLPWNRQLERRSQSSRQF